jgi:hypothetical protein
MPFFIKFCLSVAIILKTHTTNDKCCDLVGFLLFVNNSVVGPYQTKYKWPFEMAMIQYASTHFSEIRVCNVNRQNCARIRLCVLWRTLCSTKSNSWTTRILKWIKNHIRWKNINLHKLVTLELAYSKYITIT